MLAATNNSELDVVFKKETNSCPPKALGFCIIDTTIGSQRLSEEYNRISRQTKIGRRTVKTAITRPRVLLHDPRVSWSRASRLIWIMNKTTKCIARCFILLFSLFVYFDTNY